MTTKQIIISSSGLKNIVLNKYQDDDDFVFIFGEQEIRSELLSFVSRQPTLDAIIHFLRPEKVKSTHAVIMDMVNSSSAAVQARNTFIHRERRLSQMVPHSALQEPVRVQFSLATSHHQTHQTCEYINASDITINYIKSTANENQMQVINKITNKILFYIFKH